MEANNHPTQEELSGYALGALDPEEALAVEAHISTCTDCQILLKEFETITEGMAFALPPKAPPARLRARLVESIAAERPVPSSEESKANAASKASPARQAKAEARPRFPFLQLGLALTSLAVIALLIADILLANRVSQLQQQNTALIRAIQQNQQNSQVLFQPGATTLALSTGQVHGNLVISPDGMTAALFVQGLSPLDEQHIYQAWLIPANTAPLSAGLFQAAPDQPDIIFPIRSTTPIKGFAAFGVTVEPRAGSKAPTTTPILLGKF